MQTVDVEIRGTMPLLMHADNIEWSDKIKVWEKNPKNKSKSVPGDDRSPAFRWIGCLYNDGESISMPYENLMSCFRGGATMIPVPGGKGGKTFKSQSQSGLTIPDFHWTLKINGKPIAMKDIMTLIEIESFAHHEAYVQELGFSLFVKRAPIGQSKHVRVRPRFDNWSISGQIMILDSAITLPILGDILDYAGRYKGIGDWRPGAKTPGPFGRFEAQILNGK